MPQHKRATDEEVIAAYEQHKTTRAAGLALGMSFQAVHQRLVRLGVQCNNRRWAGEDERLLRRTYRQYVKHGSLTLLAHRLNRTRNALTVRACEKGLTVRRQR